MAQWTKEQWDKYFERHKNWKGNFTWRDMSWLLLGWIVGTTWMLVWLLAIRWGVI